MRIDHPIRDRRNGSTLYSGTGPVSKNLKHADLRKVDLGRADLEKAKLDGADLRRANLRDADLSFASLVGADLRKADLRGADLTGAKLDDADLRNADLSSSRLRQAWLNRARCDGADMRLAKNLKKGGLAYEAHVTYGQLIRARVDADVAASVRRLHPWRSLWYRLRWWTIGVCLSLTAIYVVSCVLP